VYNLIGYLPAPYVYGIAYEASGGNDSRWGLIAIEISGPVAGVLIIILLIKMKAQELREKIRIKRLLEDSKKATLIDNDQVGPLLNSQISDDQFNLRKRNHALLSDSSDENDEEGQRGGFKQYKTPHSDRFKLEMSALYSKSLYPISLGGIHDEEYDD
jgi:hypothetical protein